MLANLQGPKIRCGTFAEGPVNLASGNAFRFDGDPSPGNSARVCLPHPKVLQALHQGATLLVNDGKIRLKVTAVGAGFADCQVEVAGEISDRKGVSFPDVVLPVAALSDKDRDDLEFACEMGADWIALSFVQHPEDVQEAKELVRKRASVLSKIEKPSVVTVSAAIATAAKEIAEAIDIKAICCFTFGGTTAMNVAKRRPSVPIMALTPFEPAARRLTLVWGLRCVKAASVGRFKMAVGEAVRGAQSLNIGAEGDRIVVVAGVPFNRPGTTNILRVVPLDEQAVYEGETAN